MSESESKKLSELRVVDLRAELEKRGLDKNGVKKDLVERLQKALQGEGLDPETYSFDFADKKPSKRLSTSSCQGDESIGDKTDSEAEKNEKGGGKEGNGASQDEDATKDESQEKDEEEANSEEKKDANVEDKGKAAKTDQEPESINLSLEEEENINEEANDADEGNAQKKNESDEKTTAKEGQVEESKESASSSQEPKKSQEGETAANSGAPSEESTTQKKPQSNPRLLWITNVPKNTRANELKQLLSPCGKVVCAKVVVNARFPGSCCFGYITMGSAEDASNVIAKLNNTEFNGQIIKIDKFENVKADNLNPTRKNKTEEIKKSQSNERKEEKTKSPEGKEKSEQGTKNDDKGKPESGDSPERRKSLTSDRSSRGRRRTPSRERFRERDRPIHPRIIHNANVLTFDKIKEERERQRMRDRERAQREDSRRRHEEAIRIREMREVARRQRNEAERLEREREKLRLERERIEREKTELIKLERERQRLEREKLEMEKMELQRSRLRLEEDRRAVKRPLPVPFRREEPPFEDRKRPNNNERHFEEGPRFEPPQHQSPIPPKKFSSPKDFKRLNYKLDVVAEKRDFNSERPHHTSAMNRSNPSLKYDRSFDNVRGRESREAPSRESDSNLNIRTKDSRYNADRDRSPHFRPMSDNRDRHVPSQIKTDRDHHYSGPNERWNQVAPQSKFGSGGQKPWASKGTWRSDPPTGDRWNPSGGSSGRSMNQQFSGNSNMAPTCPPPPGINNYSERFDYNKSSGMRKY